MRSSEKPASTMISCRRVITFSEPFILSLRLSPSLYRAALRRRETVFTHSPSSPPNRPKDLEPCSPGDMVAARNGEVVIVLEEVGFFVRPAESAAGHRVHKGSTFRQPALTTLFLLPRITSPSVLRRALAFEGDHGRPARGRAKANSVPHGSSLRTSITLSWASTIFFTIARPSPEEPRLDGSSDD